LKCLALANVGEGHGRLSAVSNFQIKDFGENRLSQLLTAN